ncbi:MAG: hypothetical protein IT458_00025 [Planctomycetes bacterium]|nr:hypothetical protein [Planctomycetota bacterium]
MIRTVCFALVATFSLLTTALAQTPAPEEAKFVTEACQKLNAYATFAAKAGYPRRAREVWQEVIGEYDPNDEVARKELGYQRSGTVWILQKGFGVSSQDKPDPAIARILQQRWNELAHTLGDGHRKVAKALTEATQTDRANHHWDRVLRFLPGDTEASALRGLRNFEGFYGSDAEINILRRSRLMGRKIAELLQQSPAVKPVEAGRTNRFLAKAELPHKGFASENFVVFGDWDDEVLMEAARNAERALAFCKVAFEGVPGYPPDWPMYREFVFVKNRADWVGMLKKVMSPGPGLDFIVKNTSATALGDMQDGCRVAGAEQQANVNDLAVRWVAQDYAGLRSDGMVEGIGHAVVGMFFGRNLVFTVGQLRRGPGTVSKSSEEDEHKFTLPDIETWSELAMESAHQKTSAPAAELPLIQAAMFEPPHRIKAWAFCDYLLRRDPALLRVLDQARSGAKTQNDVSEKFRTASKGQDLTQLDEAWRKFWVEDTPLLRAVKGKGTPLETASKSAPDWISEFNKYRKLFQRDEVGWSSAYSVLCKEHHDYLKANATERGPAGEQTQKPNLKGFSAAGRTFAQMALVAIGGTKPEKLFESWLDLPGYRDAILNPQLKTIGLYTEGQITVVDVARGMVPSGGLKMTQYPIGNQGMGRGGIAGMAVPTEVQVKDLGPDVAARLKQLGKPDLKVLGYPLTLHFFVDLPGPRESFTCTVTVGKDAVPGFLHFAHDGTNRRSSAPGLVVFYPWQPLKRGQQHHVKWTWSRSDGAAGGPVEFQFATR